MTQPTTFVIGSHATFLSVSTDPTLCEHIGSERVRVHGILECAWCGTPILDKDKK